MKQKLSFLPVIAAVAFSGSCGVETVEPPGSDKKSDIGFSVRSTGESKVYTRGTVIVNTAELAGAGGFDALTYSHTGPWNTAIDADILIDNTGARYAHVTSPDGGVDWIYAGMSQVAWPIGKSVSSFAVAPHAAAGVTIDPPASVGDTPAIRLTLPPPGPGRQDLMFAEAGKNLTAASHGGSIPKTFHHALARVGFFAVKNESLANKDVAITGIRLLGICESGTATLEVPVRWMPTGAAADIEFTAANGALTGDLVVATAAAEARSLLTANVGTLFMLPQQLSGEQLEVTYTIDGDSFTQKRTIPLPAGDTGWTAGGSYAVMIGLTSDDIVVQPFSMPFTESGTCEIPVTGCYYVEAWGGSGGNGGKGSYSTVGSGGAGARNAAFYRFVKGQIIYVQVGGRGADGRFDQDAGGVGAGGSSVGNQALFFGAGGTGGQRREGFNAYEGGGGGGGGAASGILADGTAPVNILLAAGGGGGGGGGSYTITGMAGNDGNAGSTALRPESGIAGKGTNGRNGNGPGTGGGGGGGGGYAPNGGGGGNGGPGGNNNYAGPGCGGAGGANYTNGTSTNPSNYPVPNNSGHPSRPADGNGFVVISFLGR